MTNKNDCPRNLSKVTDNCRDCKWNYKNTQLSGQGKLVMACMKGKYWQIKEVS